MDGDQIFDRGIRHDLERIIQPAGDVAPGIALEDEFLRRHFQDHGFRLVQHDLVEGLGVGNIVTGHVGVVRLRIVGVDLAADTDRLFIAIDPVVQVFVTGKIGMDPAPGRGVVQHLTEEGLEVRAFAAVKGNVCKDHPEGGGLPFFGLFQFFQPFHLLIEVRLCLLRLNIFARTPHGVKADKENRSLPERLISLAGGMGEVVAELIHFFSGKVMIAADVNGGFVLAPESAGIIQKTKGCIVAGVPHAVFHVIAEEQEEIRFFGVGVFIHGIEAEPRHAVEVGSQKDFVVILFGIEGLERIDLPSHTVRRAVRGLIPVQRGKETVFIFGAGLQIFEVDRVQILAEINGSVLNFPYGFEFFRTFFPVLDPARAGSACDPVDRNEILRRVQEPRSVHRGGQVVLMTHIVCGSGILHGTGLHGPVVIMGVNSFGSISGKCRRCGGKKHHTEQMFLHLVSFL